MGCGGMRAEHLSVSRCPPPLGFAACAASCIPYTPPTGGAQGPPEEAAPPLLPLPGACSSFAFAGLLFA